MKYSTLFVLFLWAGCVMPPPPVAKPLQAPYSPLMAPAQENIPDAPVSPLLGVLGNSGGILGESPMALPVPIRDIVVHPTPTLPVNAYWPDFRGGIAPQQPVGGGGGSGGGVGPAVLTCTSNPMAEEVAVRVLASPLQKRVNGRCDPNLSRIAQLWAEDEVRRAYTSHVNPDGVTANAFVRINGYALPDWYPSDRNTVQSLANGYHTVDRVLGGWAGSAGHADHVFGRNEFFATQRNIGVGYAEGNNRREWVFFSAP